MTGAHALREALAQRGDIELTLRELLVAFGDDLLRFNRGQNLISRKLSVESVAALLAECALVAARPSIVSGLAAGDRVLDLGSGAGLPGIPFALCRPDQAVILLERRAGRCQFLSREKLSLGLDNVSVLCGDALDLSQIQPWAGSFSMVLMKALAPRAVALEMARPFLRPEGCAVIFASKASSADAQIFSGRGWGSVLLDELRGTDTVLEIWPAS